MGRADGGERDDRNRPGQACADLQPRRFGLGHLSRCRTIANALAAADEDISVLIISGSPIIGSFDFGARVDFVRVPGIGKRSDGEYEALNLNIGIDRTVGMRAALIRETAEMFDPDLFIVDKEPLGLRGEVSETLKLLKARGTPLVLGLRDVMDEPTMLAPEWKRKNVLPALKHLYDEIWIYGLPQFNDPLSGITLPKAVRRKTVYTGYLRRDLPRESDDLAVLHDLNRPYILVTAGGGGDGEAVVDWVLRAYERDANIPYAAIVVFGPFMAPEAREAFRQCRGCAADRSHAHLRDQSRPPDGSRRRRRRDGRLQYVLRDPVLRQEGADRAAHRAASQSVHPRPGRAIRLANMLADDGMRDPARMATALRHCRSRACRRVVIPGLLDGLPNVGKLVARHLRRPLWRPVPVMPQDDAATPRRHGGVDRRDRVGRPRPNSGHRPQGYPRLSETFIAQEIAGFGRGLNL